MVRESWHILAELRHRASLRYGARSPPVLFPGGDVRRRMDVDLRPHDVGPHCAPAPHPGGAPHCVRARFHLQTLGMDRDLLRRADVDDCDEVAAAAWSSSQPMSKLCYAAPISPGASVSTPPPAPTLRDTDPEVGYNNFCVVEGFVLKMEWLKLSADGHKRAAFSWGEDGMLISEWLAP